MVEHHPKYVVKMPAPLMRLAVQAARSSSRLRSLSSGSNNILNDP